MRIEQKLKFDDRVYDVMIGLAMESKRMKIGRVVLTGLGAAYLIFGIIILIGGSFSPIFFVGGAFMIFFGLVYMPIIVRSNIRKMNAQTRGKTVHYACDNNGVDVRSEFGESHYEWSAIRWIRDLGEYVGLNLINGNTLLFKRGELSQEQIDWLMTKAPVK